MKNTVQLALNENQVQNLKAFADFLEFGDKKNFLPMLFSYFADYAALSELFRRELRANAVLDCINHVFTKNRPQGTTEDFIRLVFLFESWAREDKRPSPTGLRFRRKNSNLYSRYISCSYAPRMVSDQEMKQFNEKFHPEEFFRQIFLNKEPLKTQIKKNKHFLMVPHQDGVADFYSYGNQIIVAPKTTTRSPK